MTAHTRGAHAALLAMIGLLVSGRLVAWGVEPSARYVNTWGDPLLGYLYHQLENNGALAKTDDDAALAVLAATAPVYRSAHGAAMVDVFALTSGPLADLDAADARLKSQIGDVAVVSVPIHRLPALAALPGVATLRAAETAVLHLDQAVPLAAGGANHADAIAHTNGTGVVIAVIDSGLDWTSPDFCHPDGTTRVLALWDMTDPTGRPPAEFPHGRGTEYLAEEINANLARIVTMDAQPVPIPAYGKAESELLVDYDGVVDDVIVDVRLMHEDIDQLRIALYHPASDTRVVLHDRTGARNFIFATYSGATADAQSLSEAFDGQPARGTWRLEIEDQQDDEIGGRLVWWRLRFNQTIRSRDLIGHGTHVMGCAAGSGRASANGQPAGTYRGMAPGAWLIAVKATTTERSGVFYFTDVMDALAYADMRAGERPCVINLSLGGQLGPHDGSLPIEQAIDALVNGDRPGRIVVCSAGNDGQAPIHGQATGVSVDGTQAFTVAIGGGLPQAQIDIWYAGENDYSRENRLYPPNAQAPVAGITPLGMTMVYETGGAFPHRVQVDHYTDAVNGDNRILYTIRPGEGAAVIQPGVWRVVLGASSVADNDGEYHVWVHPVGGVQVGTEIRTFTHLVGQPGCAANAITVGAYTTRKWWKGMTGFWYRFAASSEVGELAPFSSPGPTRDGRIKPEIIAPGAAIAATLANDAVPASPGGVSMYGSTITRLVETGTHGIAQGTSFSAPLAAGACALVLQLMPHATVADIKSLITGGANGDLPLSAGALPNNSWGFGRIDVGGALALDVAGWDQY